MTGKVDGIKKMHGHTCTKLIGGKRGKGEVEGGRGREGERERERGSEGERGDRGRGGEGERE